MSGGPAPDATAEPPAPAEPAPRAAAPARPLRLLVVDDDEVDRRAVRRACQHLARLPMRGPIASLNASVAGALALYEILRQRGPTKP